VRACTPSAAEQSRGRPQDKAAWAAGAYGFLRAVPDRAGPAEPLSPGSLEADLARRAAGAARPGPALPGHADVAVQDLVSATVREIVGVLESLLDRLLLEKKTDTIRNMVAELVTTDVASTIAVGREQLRHREFARIDAELERLGAEARGSSARWDEHLGAMRQLRGDHESLGAVLGERVSSLEARLVSVEQGFVSRPELDAHLKAAAREASELGARLTVTEERLSQAFVDLRDLESRSADSLAAALAQADDRVDCSLSTVQQEVVKQLQELRGSTAPLARLGELEAALDAATGAARAGLAELRQELDGLSGTVQRERLRGEAAVGAQAEAQASQRQGLEALRLQVETRERALRDELAGLAAGAAMRGELEREQASTREALGALHASLSAASSQAQASTVGLRQLEDFCHGSLATKDFAGEVARAHARHVAEEFDKRAAVEQLRREFEDEQERSRQTMRQVQASRRDLSDMIEVFHETRGRCGELGAQCGLLAQQVQDLDGREAEHWSQAQAEASRQGRAQEQLEALHRALREELASQAEMQRGEAERLRNHSTQRYLEQMDRALDLHRGLESVAMGHRELNEAVRSIRLPKVALAAPAPGTAEHAGGARGGCAAAR